MAQLANCSSCGNIFAKTMRDICPACYKAEEEAFKIVYKFLSLRKNREATMEEIVERTGVEQELIIKFMKQKRLRSSKFPKLSYPCEQCGVAIVEGIVCHACATKVKEAINQHTELEQKEEERKKRLEDHQSIYYSTINQRDEK